MPARSPAPRRAARSRRLTGALCASLLAAFAALLWQQTAGLEVWTFDGQRERQLQAGALRAAPVALRVAAGEPRLWGEGAAGAYLVDFVYTRCPGVCRALGSEFQQMQAQLDGDPAAVKLVSVSFDVAHDDLPQLARHAASLHADPARWRFAVPATPGESQVLLRSLGVIAVPDGAGGWVHNGDIHLLDAQGRLRGLYAFDDWPRALAAARRLAGTAS